MYAMCGPRGLVHVRDGVRLWIRDVWVLLEIRLPVLDPLSGLYCSRVASPADGPVKITSPRGVAGPCRQNCVPHHMPRQSLP